jgi:hypothetical protein
MKLQAFIIEYSTLLYFVLIYVGLARFFKRFSKTVQFHSMLHCFVSSIWCSIALYKLSDGNLLSTDFYNILNNINESDKGILEIAAFHSLGYFLGDTIDIFIDFENKKRRIYLFHHCVAIMGLLTIYWDSFLCLYALWTLELGGIVHHFRFASTVFEFTYPYSTLVEALYHIVYVTSRGLLLVTTNKTFAFVNDSKNPLLDGISCGLTYVLIIQNAIWWIHNVRTLISDKKKKI